MAPLLLLFLLGGICALFSLTSASSRAAGAKQKCDDDDGTCGDAGVSSRDTKDGGAGERVEEEKKTPRPDDAEADLGIVFSTFDHDGDGFITAVELEESLRRLGIAVSADEAKAMVARVDANGDGLIDMHEFRELYDPIPGKRKHQHHAVLEKFAAGDGAGNSASLAVVVEDEEEEAEEEEEERGLREAFDVFDGNKDGLISAEELGSGRPAVADCRDMIRLVDSDGDAMVNFEEFKRMMAIVKA